MTIYDRLKRFLVLPPSRIRDKRLSRRSKKRRATIEILEARQLLAAAIWHNILQPLNVSGETGGSVDPLDVLTIVNEINSPKFSDPTNGTLPFELPDGTSNPFLDIDCDSRVTPLDVLSVINAINTGSYAPDWVFSETGSNDAANGRVTNAGCFPKLIEGNSLHTHGNRTLISEWSNDCSRRLGGYPTFGYPF